MSIWNVLYEMGLVDFHFFFTKMAAELKGRCCSCNGKNARCKSCVCCKKKRKCSNCLPMNSKCCFNSNMSHSACSLEPLAPSNSIPRASSSLISPTSPTCSSSPTPPTQVRPPMNTMSPSVDSEPLSNSRPHVACSLTLVQPHMNTRTTFQEHSWTKNSIKSLASSRGAKSA